MINSFKLKNFRSYAEEADLTFEAQPSELNSGAVKCCSQWRSGTPSADCRGYFRCKCCG